MMWFLAGRNVILVFAVTVFGIQGRPSWSLNLPAIGPFRNFGQSGRHSFHIKSYSGKRIKNDSIRMVYFHDQTVAIVELEPDKLLLNCELIEVYACGTRAASVVILDLIETLALRLFGIRDRHWSHVKSYSGKTARSDSILRSYIHDQTVVIVEIDPEGLLSTCELIDVSEPEDAIKALGDFQQVARPVAISFKEMITLMRQCQQVEDSKTAHGELAKNRTSRPVAGRGILANNPFVLLSGIIPGTKWCGTGDIAKDYYDLGSEPAVDKCCRAHDLCPVKVRAFSERYNITNDSLYTKSHCQCDDRLYSCLKENTSPTAHIMGTIYFNLVQIPCLEDTKLGRRYRNPKKSF